MARGAIEDPLKKFKYRVIIGGFARAAFTEVSGLKKTTDVIKYKEGGGNDTEQKSPGLSHYGPITLSRGLIVRSSRGGETDFATWLDKVHSLTQDGSDENPRLDLTIRLFNPMNQPMIDFEIFNAFPSEDSPFDGLGGNKSENIIEALTLEHEGFRRKFL